MIKAVSAANGQQEQQLLTANCVIPGSKGLKQYSQLNLDKCLGWRRTNDGGGALVALKNGGGLSKKGGQCSKCRYLQSSPNLICNCAGVRQDQKTYVDPATATWMGPVLFDLDAVLLSGKPLIEVTGQGLLACHGVV
ncbi:hypothetical protein BDV26DRAFT_293580 [Aspergillus bertholletiae]|uniref:Cyanovirin-N domain-containing protein n=1 Tax=Aspergillus bertholletiae TaxID=1226010 RepID=A0A5N7B4J1_9EURO|nr:hypothetical protein BDV26DRAFT_293580 [Aspergillus bertholletiae]